MKKMLLVLGVAAAAMTSCTNDEVVEVNPANVIKFESFVNKGTRAVTDTDRDISKFYVFGAHASTLDFNNKLVSKSGTTWNYEGYVYWTVADYKFGAYAQNNATAEISITTSQTDPYVSFNQSTGALTFTNYTVNDANDLVAALVEMPVTAIDSDPGTVDFDFQHLLSKIQFTLVNGETDHTMYISELEIAQYPQKGTCTYSSTGVEWTNITDGTEKSLSSNLNAVGIAYNASYQDNFLVIPTAAPTGETTTISDAYTVTFKVTFMNSSSEIVSEEVIEPIQLNLDVLQWKPGYVYNYTATLGLNQRRIEFGAPDVAEWDSDLDKDGKITDGDDDITLQQ